MAYALNASRKYDCPEADCDRKGKNGFNTPQAVGRHRLTVHQIGRTHAANGNGAAHAATAVRSNLGALATAAPGITPDAANVERAIDPIPALINGRATVVAMATLQIGEAVRELTAAEASAVFGAVVASKQ